MCSNTSILLHLFGICVYDIVCIEVEMAKKVYLLVYNGVQWAGFILIVMNLLKCLTKGRGGPVA